MNGWYEMVNRKILITGAGGFTGWHACQYFLNNGYHVVGLVRKKRFNKDLPNYKEWECDLTDEFSVYDTIKAIKPDYILHTAGKNDVKESWEKPAEYVTVNVLATVHLLEAVRKVKNNGKILVIGSALEFDPSGLLNHPYGLTKTFQSLVAKSWQTLFHLPIMIAKPTNLIGPGPSNGFCSLIAEKIALAEKDCLAEPVLIDDSTQERDFLDVRDAVRAYELILLKGKIGEVYPIGTGCYRTLKNVIDSFQSLTTVPVPVHMKVNKHDSGTDKAQGKMDLTNIRALDWHPGYPFLSSLNDILTYYRNKG